jgi:hypothetical protein
MCNANQWQSLWTDLEQNISEKLNFEIKIKLRNQEQKIQNEINRQNNIPIHFDSTENKQYAILY